MSDKCGNCDCSDKSQCVKKGNTYGVDIVEPEKSYICTLVMDAASEAAIASAQAAPVASRCIK